MTRVLTNTYNGNGQLYSVHDSATGKTHNVKVATSDALVQLSSLRSGVLRMSARELRQEIDTAREEMAKHF